MIANDGPAAHHSRRRGRVGVTVVMVGASAAPALWLAQMLLSYGISADVCAGLHWAATGLTRPALRNTLFTFDAIAASGAIGGGLLSYRSWHRAGAGGAEEDGVRFLAECGMLSSLWFFGAIVFNTIASIMIAPCVR